MSIDPRVGAWFNFAFLVLTGIGAGAVVLPGANDALVADIKGWAVFVAFVISCANLVFHLFDTPSSTPTGIKRMVAPPQ